MPDTTIDDLLTSSSRFLAIFRELDCNTPMTQDQRKHYYIARVAAASAIFAGPNKPPLHRSAQVAILYGLVRQNPGFGSLYETYTKLYSNSKKLDSQHRQEAGIEILD